MALPNRMEENIFFIFSDNYNYYQVLILYILVAIIRMTILTSYFIEHSMANIFLRILLELTHLILLKFIR